MNHPKDLQEAAVDLSRKIGNPDALDEITEALANERERNRAEIEHWRCQWRASSFGLDASAAVADDCRRFTKEIIGSNCTFVDDDLKLLATLADAAVEAGLYRGLPQKFIDSIEERRVARRQGDVE